MTRRMIITSATAVAALGLVCAGGASAASAQPSGGEKGSTSVTVPVQGRQIPIDDTGHNYRMTGGLVGKWRINPTLTLHDAPTLYSEAGQETFDGCLDLNRNGRCGHREPQGRLRSVYLYWVSFDSDGKLVRGQCIHPITGGDGDFAGARGVIDMVDRPVGDEVRTTYRGTVILNAEPSEIGQRVAAKTAPSSGAAKVSNRSQVGC
jgi:hypothetical protein